jgi:hypothetical protein
MSKKSKFEHKVVIISTQKTVRLNIQRAHESKPWPSGLMITVLEEGNGEFEKIGYLIPAHNSVAGDEMVREFCNQLSIPVPAKWEELVLQSHD